MPRYNKIALNKVVEQLEQWVEQTEEVRSNEEDKDYHNEERMDELTNRIGFMEEAVNALQGIE